MQISRKDFFIETKNRDYAWSMHKLHYHDSYELYYLNSGKRTVLFENRIYHLQPGDLLLMRPNVLHKGVGTDAHGKLGIEFSKRFLDYYFTASTQKDLLSCYKYTLIRLNDEEQKQFESLYNKIYSEYTSEKIYAVTLAQLLLMLNDMGKRHENEIHGIDTLSSKKPERIKRILTYIEENFSEIKSIDEIAEHFYLNKSYLCRLFKKETNMTVMDYLYNYRIQQACERLTSTKHTIAEIARYCGFENTSHFIKLFKSMLDCTPGEFRKKRG